MINLKNKLHVERNQQLHKHVIHVWDYAKIKAVYRMDFYVAARGNTKRLVLRVMKI